MEKTREAEELKTPVVETPDGGLVAVSPNLEKRLEMLSGTQIDEADDAGKHAEHEGDSASESDVVLDAPIAPEEVARDVPNSDDNVTTAEAVVKKRKIVRAKPYINVLPLSPPPHQPVVAAAPMRDPWQVSLDIRTFSIALVLVVIGLSLFASSTISQREKAASDADFKQLLSALVNKVTESPVSDRTPLADGARTDFEGDARSEPTPASADSLGPVGANSAYPHLNQLANLERISRLALAAHQHKEYDEYAALPDETNNLRLPFVGNVTDFVRGYLRIRLACEDVKRVRGWFTMSAVEDSDVSYQRSIYMASASPLSPYFCLNLDLQLPLNADKKAGSMCDVMRPKEIEERDLGSLCQWRTLFRNHDDMGAFMFAPLAHSTAFVKHDLFHPALLGYTKSEFSIRPLEHLGAFNLTQLGGAGKLVIASNRTLHSQPVRYERLFKTVVALYNDLLRLNAAGSSDMCVCGAHLGWARHIVIYMSKRHTKANLYVEPVVISPRWDSFFLDEDTAERGVGVDDDGESIGDKGRDGTGSYLNWIPFVQMIGGEGRLTLDWMPKSKDGLRKLEQLPWVKMGALLNPEEEDSAPLPPLVREYLRTDEKLRRELIQKRPASSTAYFVNTEIVIDSLDIDTTTMTLGGARRLDKVRDSEAACIHYCTYLGHALSVRGMALQSPLKSSLYESRIGTDIYLGPAPLPKTLLMFGQTIASRTLFNPTNASAFDALIVPATKPTKTKG